MKRKIIGIVVAVILMASAALPVYAEEPVSTQSFFTCCGFPQVEIKNPYEPPTCSAWCWFQKLFP